ncbi:MAG: nicotinate (nicotinamide) nucleotide adenylyltransferase [Planctomycetota bacterium]
MTRSDQHGRDLSSLPVPAAADGVLLFGGTFDPPHLGHQRLAQLARDSLFGDAGWLVFVPAAQSPHKQSGPIASDEHRLAMLSSVSADVPRSAVWPFELLRGLGPSYWIDTIREAAKQAGTRGLGREQLRFLIGADQAAAFHRWKDFAGILELATPAVILRDPISTADTLLASLEASRTWTPEQMQAWQRWVVLTETMPVSSTSIRSALANNGADLAAKLSPAVLDYIRANDLYS